jgi:4'-phosphopantetheinyl transferase
MVFAFTHDRRIGVDVERIRPIPNASALVERFFSPREQHDFQKLPETLQLEAFFNAWTRKEAVLKGTGDGVNYVDRCEVTLLPGEPPCLLALHDDPDAGQNWTLTSWIPESGFIAALAIETKPI